jgi:hypothetical protein
MCLPRHGACEKQDFPQSNGETPAPSRPVSAAAVSGRLQTLVRRRESIDSKAWKAITDIETSDRRDGAPVDDILASGDRCGAIRGKEGDQLGDLCRPGRTAKRDAAE